MTNDPDKEQRTMPRLPSPQSPYWKPMLVFALVACGGVWLWNASRAQEATSPVPYSQICSWISAGKVEAVVLDGEQLTAKLAKPETMGGRTFQFAQSAVAARDEALLPLLRQHDVRIEVKGQAQGVGLQFLLGFAPWLLIFLALSWLSRRAKGPFGANAPMADMLKSKGRAFDKETAPKVTFDDIAGLKSAKADLQEIVDFLKTPDRFRRLGGTVPRGVLLIGPPGTGKTLLARAVAGESAVSFFSISASEFIEMFVGVGAARVRDLFREAKKGAPAIVFIDEIDAVGRSRGAGLGGGNDEREQTLNQLLSEMDGFERNDLVIVIAATNRPDVLDPALLRPGRFDRRVLVDRPELAARQSILAVHTRGKPLAPDVDLGQVAANTPGFSGADLANLSNEAALFATRKGQDVITAANFSEAFDKIVLGDPREGKLSQSEKRRVAVHEAGHAVVAHFSTHAEPLHRVSVLPRGMALGVTQQSAGEDRHLMAEAELGSRLRVFMGGLAAERLVLESVSTGAENDLKEATRLASHMVAHYGMSKTLGPVYYDHEAEHPFLGQRMGMAGGTSAGTVAAIEQEARLILGQALDQASALLSEKRDRLDALVEALLAKETLDKEELGALLGSAQPVAAAL